MLHEPSQLIPSLICPPKTPIIYLFHKTIFRQFSISVYLSNISGKIVVICGIYAIKKVATRSETTNGVIYLNDSVYLILVIELLIYSNTPTGGVTAPMLNATSTTIAKCMGSKPNSMLNV